MAQGFSWWVQALGRSPHVPGISQKYVRPRRHPPYWGRLRSRAMNLTPSPKGVKACGEGPLRPKEISRYRDTLGQIRAADNTAGRSSTRHLERCQTEIDLPLWQRNLSVLITVRRAQYGEIGKNPTTLSSITILMLLFRKL